jgi:hypothetical protein
MLIAIVCTSKGPSGNAPHRHRSSPPVWPRHPERPHTPSHSTCGRVDDGKQVCARLRTGHIDGGLGLVWFTVSSSCFGRSFDHMLGVKAGTNPAINGCPPSNSAAYCSNPVDPTNSSSPRIHTDNQAVYVQPADPDHSVEGTSEQMFGSIPNPPDGMTPLMDGFVYSCRFCGCSVVFSHSRAY